MEEDLQIGQYRFHHTIGGKKCHLIFEICLDDFKKQLKIRDRIISLLKRMGITIIEKRK
jgi:hypothetical protein